MCGRSRYCRICRLPLEIRLCSAVSSLLPWVGSHALSSARVQRSSGAAAMGHLSFADVYIRIRMWLWTAGTLACVLFAPGAEVVEERPFGETGSYQGTSFSRAKVHA